jgi:hypothetical protein
MPQNAAGIRIPVERRAERGPDAGRRRDVLDRDGKPGKRSEALPAHDRRLDGARLLFCLLGRERHDGVELGVHARDHRQMRVENLDRAHRARLDHGGEFARSLSRQTLISHRIRHFPDQWTNWRSTSRNRRLRP